MHLTSKTLFDLFSILLSYIFYNGRTYTSTYYLGLEQKSGVHYNEVAQKMPIQGIFKVFQIYVCTDIFLLAPDAATKPTSTYNTVKDF